MKKRRSWLWGVLLLGILMFIPFGKAEASELPPLEFEYEMTGQIGADDANMEVKLPLELLYEGRNIQITISALDELFTYDYLVVSEAGEIICGAERNGIHPSGSNNHWVSATVPAGMNEIIVNWSRYNEADAQGGGIKIHVQGGYIIRPERLMISSQSACIMQGRTFQLEASYAPKNANVDTLIRWTSSDESVATVDTDGLVSAYKEGIATITASAGSVTATCQVQVKKGQGTYVPVKEISGQVKSGKRANISFTLPVKAGVSLLFVKDESGRAPRGRARFYLEQKGKTLWKGMYKFNGQTTHFLTPNVLDPGTYTLIIEGDSSSFKYGGYILCETIDYYKATGIKLNKKTKTVAVGKQFYLNGSVTPAYTTNPVKWTSSNKKVAKVDQDGLITAKNMGKTVITATVDGKKAKCTIYVTKQKLESWTGKTKDLSKKVKNVPGYKKGKWTSSNPSVASVDSKGRVTYRAHGKAKITFTAKGKKYVFTVYAYSKSKLKEAVVKEAKGDSKDHPMLKTFEVKKVTFDNKNFACIVKYWKIDMVLGTGNRTAAGYYYYGKFYMVE